MLAFALRRAVWAIPTLIGVSLVVFLLTTLLPDPDATLRLPPGDVAGRMQRHELRRSHFLDLPRLINVSPRDVRTLVEQCTTHIVADDADAAYCSARLAKAGGAALPQLLPHLDDLPPAGRGRIAVALAPIAHRMKIGDDADLLDPTRAVPFWVRFWADRSIDFTEPAVKRSVQRLAARENDLLEQDIRLVDTFALQQLVVAMSSTGDPAALARLTRAASYVAGRDGEVRPDASKAEIRAVVSQWQSWWYVHETDYIVLQGGEKVAASVVQTRYAKWVLGAITGQLGLSTRDGLPIFDKLLARAPVTIGMAVLALLLSAAAGVPLGTLAAWRRGESVDHLVGAAILVVYSVPTFLVAELLSALRPEHGSSFVLPVLTLATVSVAALAQQERASMLDALAQDYVRAARAKGARTFRVVTVHALRNALVPTVTLAGVQFPALVGGAFVVEEVFGVHGLGWETLRAIESHDAAWIVAVTLLCASVTTAGLVASDIAYGLLDPRVRERQTRRRVA